MDYYEIKDLDKLLKKYSNDYLVLANIINNIDDEIIDFIPKVDNPWSIKEHISHLVDSEVNCFIRYKKAILNPGVKLDLGQGDIEASNEILNYASQNLEDLLDFFKVTRKLIYDHAQNLSHQDFEKYYIEHPDFGKCNLKFILSAVSI